MLSHLLPKPSGSLKYVFVCWEEVRRTCWLFAFGPSACLLELMEYQDCHQPDLEGVCVCVCVSLVAQSCLTLCGLIGCSPQTPLSMEFFSQGYWSELHFPFQGIFLTQGLNLCLLHLLPCRQILYHWCRLGSPQWNITQP